MKQSNLLFLAVASVLAAGVAIAAPATAPVKAPAAHAKLDANGDGVIDRSEAAARPRFAQKFDQFDKNRDGRIDASERPQHRMGGMHGGGFARLDANGDGAIDRAEAAKRPGFAKMFDQLDRNHDGRIDRSERPQWRGRGGGMARLDADHDGRLSRAEAGSTPMARKFDQLDVNRDGFVDRDEARAAFRRMREERAARAGNS